jgi:membrane-associated phospholipid phosphatase
VLATTALVRPSNAQTRHGDLDDEAPPPRQPSIVMKTETGEPRVYWHSEWRRSGIGDYLLGGGLLAATLATLAIPPTEDRWPVSASNAFDDGVRSALRLETLEERYVANDASDVTLLLSLNQVLVDTLIVAWWAHDADTVAWEMTVTNVQALGINNLIQGAVAGFVSRERPYGADDCVGPLAEQLEDCRSSKRYRSFFSGHSSTSATLAALTCVHHAHIPLYGGGWPEGIPCFVTIGLSIATATLRVTSDRHWASDVIVGSGFGALTGAVVPLLLRYQGGDPEDPGPKAMIGPAGGGVGILGVF